LWPACNNHCLFCDYQPQLPKLKSFLSKQASNSHLHKNLANKELAGEPAGLWLASWLADRLAVRLASRRFPEGKNCSWTAYRVQ